MVSRAAAILSLLVAVLVAGPVAIAGAQDAPDSGTTSTETTETTTQENDLYATCRKVGNLLDSIPVLNTGAERLCDVGMAASHPTAAVGEFAGGLGADAVSKAAESFFDGWKRGISLMLSWWMTNSITGPASGDTEATVWQVHKYLRIFEIAAFVVSVGVSAVRLAWARTQLLSQHAQEAALMVTRTVFASWMLVPLVLAGDELSRAAGSWLIKSLVGENIDGALAKVVAVSAAGSGLGAGLLFIFAIMGLIGTVVQAAFVLVQLSLLRLVLAWAPIAAAASGIGAGGSQPWVKLRNWVIVFTLFPFAAASVYAVAFTTAAGAHDAQGMFAGMVLLTLSFLTLPALARLIVPNLGSMAGGSGAGVIAGGATAATGAVAGTQMIASMSSGGGGGPVQGGRSGEEPTGASSTGGGPSPSPGTGTGGGGGAKPGPGPSGAGQAAGAGAAAGGGMAAAAGPVGAAAAAGSHLADGVKSVADKVSSTAEDAAGGPSGAVDTNESSPGAGHQQ